MINILIISTVLKKIMPGIFPLASPFQNKLCTVLEYLLLKKSCECSISLQTTRWKSSSAVICLHFQLGLTKFQRIFLICLFFLKDYSLQCTTHWNTFRTLCNVLFCSIKTSVWEIPKLNLHIWKSILKNKLFFNA